MTERLSLTQIAVLFGYAFGMTGGQMLFKLAALRLPQDGSAVERAFGRAAPFLRATGSARRCRTW